MTITHLCPWDYSVFTAEADLGRFGEWRQCERVVVLVLWILRLRLGFGWRKRELQTVAARYSCGHSFSNLGKSELTISN